MLLLLWLLFVVLLLCAAHLHRNRSASAANRDDDTCCCCCWLTGASFDWSFLQEGSAAEDENRELKLSKRNSATIVCSLGGIGFACSFDKLVGKSVRKTTFWMSILQHLGCERVNFTSKDKIVLCDTNLALETIHRDSC